MRGIAVFFIHSISKILLTVIYIMANNAKNNPAIVVIVLIKETVVFIFSKMQSLGL
jgi:hypothetical protein